MASVRVVTLSGDFKQNRNWFYLNFLLKAWVLYLTILKQKTLSLPLKVETVQPVICFVLAECLSVKICRISPSDCEAKRDGADAKSHFLLFFSFINDETTNTWEIKCLENSSPRDKVGKLSLFWEWRAESQIVSIIVVKYSIFPCANNGRSREKKFWRSYFLTLSACAIVILSTLTYTEFDCAALLAM